MITASELATAPSPTLLREMQILFRNAINEDFEFGMQSEFIKALESRLNEYGAQAVQAISNVIDMGQADPQVVAETLRWLGGITHPDSYLVRQNVLVSSLSAQSPWVRDGAALGLHVMDDARTLPALRDAVDRETIPELRTDIESVLHWLERTK